MLRASSTKYVVVFARNGLGKLAAKAAAADVGGGVARPAGAADLGVRPPPQLQLPRLFADLLPFALLEEIPPANLSDSEFQRVNYMRPEPGAVKDAPVDVDVDRHLYFKSGFVMNHPPARGSTRSGTSSASRRSTASSACCRRTRTWWASTCATSSTRRATRRRTRTRRATRRSRARKEYGAEGTAQLLMWRNASHWTNFVARMEGELREAYESRVDLLRTQREPSPLPSAAALAPRSDGHDLCFLPGGGLGRVVRRAARALSGAHPVHAARVRVWALRRPRLRGADLLPRRHAQPRAHEAHPRLGVVVTRRWRRTGAAGAAGADPDGGRDFGEVVRGDDVGDFGRIKESEERKVYGHGAFGS